MKKLSAAILLLLMACLPALAQTDEQLSDGFVKNGEHHAQALVSDVDSTNAFNKQQRLQFGMSLGTGVSFTSGYGAGVNTWLAPHMSYRVSPKFTVDAGLRLETNSLNNHTYFTLADGSTYGFYKPTTALLLYASGSYDVSKKMRLTGTVFGGTQTYDLPGLQPGSYKLNTYGGSLNMEYKLGEHSSISAGVQISRGPSYASPYDSPLGSPFFNH